MACKAPTYMIVLYADRSAGRVGLLRLVIRVPGRATARSAARAARDATIGKMSASPNSKMPLAVVGGVGGGGRVRFGFPPGVNGGVVTTPTTGGGGVVCDESSGRVAPLKVATVVSIAVCLALPSPPLTFGRFELSPRVALARSAALMTPEFTMLPVTLAKLFAPTLTVWVPLVTATEPVRT